MDYYTKYLKYKNKYLDSKEQEKKSFSSQKGGSSELLDLDKIILNNSIWSELTKIYNSKVAKEIEIGILKTDVKNVLIFLNGYRRLLVDYYINRSINFVLPLSADKYKTFMQDKTFNELIKTTAFGAESPTSDYDVTLEGPGVHIIMNNILGDFQRNINKTTAITFDTNIYIGPVLRLNIETNYKFLKQQIPELQFFELAKRENNLFSGVPIPLKKEILKIEWNNITSKFNEEHTELTNEIIMDKYNNLFKIGEKIDKLVYQMDNSIFNNKNNLEKEIIFFNLLLDGCKTSIESAYALSTIIIVVYGIQGKKDISFLKKENYLISIYENLSELKNHWNFNNSKDDSVKLKVAKYIYRILFALEKANLAPEFTKYLKDMQFVNDNKSSKDILNSTQFNVLKTVFLIDKNNILTNDVFSNILQIINSEKITLGF